MILQTIFLFIFNPSITQRNHNYERIILTDQKQGSLPNPPLALVDFYGTKYYSKPDKRGPKDMAPGVPDLPDELAQRIWDEPVISDYELTWWPNPKDPESIKNATPRMAWLIMSGRKG
jgi:hypothetical protein